MSNSDDAIADTIPRALLEQHARYGICDALSDMTTNLW